MAEANMYQERRSGQFMTPKIESLATMRALTLFNYGITIESSNAMIAITTSSSMSVNPFLLNISIPFRIKTHTRKSIFC